MLLCVMLMEPLVGTYLSTLRIFIPLAFCSLIISNPYQDTYTCYTVWMRPYLLSVCSRYKIFYFSISWLWFCSYLVSVAQACKGLFITVSKPPTCSIQIPSVNTLQSTDDTSNHNLLTAYAFTTMRNRLKYMTRLELWPNLWIAIFKNSMGWDYT